MVAHLPSPDPAPLSGTHLELVVCQLRFESHPSASDIEVGLALQSKLGGRDGSYRHLEPQEMRTAVVELNPNGLFNTQAPSTRGWRMRSRSGDWAVSLMPDSVSIETTAYTVWEGDFRERLDDIVNAVEDIVAPRAQERLGLRYINRIPSPDAPTEASWADLIAPEFLGPLAHPALREGIISTQQQTEIQVDDRIQCVMRQGLLKDVSGTTANSFLLDFDLFSPEPEIFKPESALELADQLNLAALSMFQLSLNSSYLAHLRE